MHAYYFGYIRFNKSEEYHVPTISSFFLLQFYIRMYYVLSNVKTRFINFGKSYRPITV